MLTGIDAIQFGSQSVTCEDETHGVDPIDTELGSGHRHQLIKRRFKKIVHGVYSLHNNFKEIQLTSDLVRVFESTKDTTDASLPTTPNPMRCILSVCRNSTASSAKSRSQNRRSLRIVDKHETIDAIYNASDMRRRFPQSRLSDINIKCLMVVLMLMFIMCKCPKRLSFYTVILMMVSGVLGDEYCDTSYECVKQSRPINRTDTLRSRGYKSNSGGTTDITVEWDNNRVNFIACYGSFSCANIGYMKGSSPSDSFSFLMCSGVLGCSNTSVNLTGNINRGCSGSNSCYGVTFHSYGEMALISCNGDRSCANTDIHSHNEIRARGSYTLYNASIHSTTDGLAVYLFGSNAGFGAKIFCPLGHSCTIYCYATGCNMLYVDCDGECDIRSNSSDTVLPITDYNLFDESQLNIPYDSSALAKSNDAACLLMFDDYYENIYANISGTNVCCRGDWSCYGSTIYSTTSVVCSGWRSCNSDNISANDAIFCSASYGCKSSNLYSLNDIYCLGDRACHGTTITTRNLYCSGYESCEYSTILNTETIYFMGDHSGDEAVINCSDIAFCNIICDGYLSCYSIAFIHCNECIVSCNRDTGCPPGYTYAPTSDPTSHPTLIPTMIPTLIPTMIPTMIPTDNQSWSAMAWMGIAVVILLTLLIAAIFYIKRLRNIKKKLQKAILQGKKESKMMEMGMEAAKAKPEGRDNSVSKSDQNEALHHDNIENKEDSIHEAVKGAKAILAKQEHQSGTQQEGETMKHDNIANNKAEAGHEDSHNSGNSDDIYVVEGEANGEDEEVEKGALQTIQTTEY